MREITRNTLLIIGVVVVLLLALGAVPSLLKSGDPYYVTAEPVAAENGSVEPINASTLSTRAYPYTFAALADAPEGGQSEPYWKGPFGFKESFTHSPFDEFAAYNEQYSGASDGDSVFIRAENTTFRLTITQESQ